MCYKAYPNNQEITLEYAKGLMMLYVKQKPSELKKTSKRLKKLLEDYPDLSEFFDEDVI